MNKYVILYKDQILYVTAEEFGITDGCLIFFIDYKLVKAFAKGTWCLVELA